MSNVDQLILDHLHLVDHILWLANAPSNMDADDLRAAGYEGLCHAAHAFDPSKGRFSAFAWYRIHGAIIDEWRREDIGRYARRQQQAINRARHTFAAREHRFPSDQELADALGWSMDALAAAQRAGMRSTPLRLDLPISDGSDIVDFHELIGDPNARPVEDVEREIIAEQVRGMMLSLTERERVVLGLYFWQDMTLAQIGDVLGVTESRISQIRTGALRRLRADSRVMALAA